MRGFTLIELMGVIVILSIIAIVTIVGVDKLIVNGKNDLYNKQINIIELSAKNWLTDNMNQAPTNEPLEITLQELSLAGYISSNIENPKTGKSFSPETKIVITKVGNTYEYKVVR